MTRTRSLRRAVLIIVLATSLAALLAFSADSLQANEWPLAARTPTPATAPQPTTGHAKGAWSSKLWLEPETGAPTAPSTRHCDRPPQAFDINVGSDPQAQQQSRLLRQDSPEFPGQLADLAVSSGKAAVVAAPKAPPPPAAMGGSFRSSLGFTQLTKSSASPQQVTRPPYKPVTAGVVDDNADLEVTPAEAKLAPSKPQLDIVFLINATGSMADEIDKLKRSMRAAAEQIAQLPSLPDVCYALVAYRDRGDAIFVRGVDFTNDLVAFEGHLEQVLAEDAGGKPEALNQPWDPAVHRLSWRGHGAPRMVVLVADAAPHLDHGKLYYDNDAIAALVKSVRRFVLGASGLDPEDEEISRQVAQYTGGRFIFLTYADANDPSSGPGR